MLGLPERMATRTLHLERQRSSAGKARILQSTAGGNQVFQGNKRLSLKRLFLEQTVKAISEF